MSRIAIVHFVNYKRGTQSRAAMRGVMLYVMQEKKTMWEGEPLISGINCQPQSVYDDFINTKLLHHKDSGVMFYHMVQSFPKGEAVDPRQAHEAARRLAEYFEGCEVLVCTHVDREHIHSHCVINSVNFETGKKLHMAKEQLQELMRRNDAICQELGLPVFQPTNRRHAHGMSGAEYHTALKGQSWKLRLMNTIDECMKYAADKDAFISLMESEGYSATFSQSPYEVTDLSLPAFEIYEEAEDGEGNTVYYGLFYECDYYDLGSGLEDLNNPEYTLVQSKSPANLTIDAEGNFVSFEQTHESSDDPEGDIRRVCGPMTELADFFWGKTESYPKTPRKVPDLDAGTMAVQYLNYYFAEG